MVSNVGENSDEFNLDNLRVDEEEVRSPAIFPLSVVVCKTEFVEQVDNVPELIRRIKDRLLDRYAYKIIKHLLECFYDEYRSYNSILLSNRKLF